MRKWLLIPIVAFLTMVGLTMPASAADVIYQTKTCHDPTYGMWGYAKTLDVGALGEEVDAHARQRMDLPGTNQHVGLNSVWMHTHSLGWTKMSWYPPIHFDYISKRHAHKVIVEFHWSRYIGGVKIPWPGNDYTCRVTIPPRK